MCVFVNIKCAEVVHTAALCLMFSVSRRKRWRLLLSVQIRRTNVDITVGSFRRQPALDSKTEPASRALNSSHIRTGQVVTELHARRDCVCHTPVYQHHLRTGGLLISAHFLIKQLLKANQVFKSLLNLIMWRGYVAEVEWGQQEDSDRRMHKGRINNDIRNMRIEEDTL